MGALFDNKDMINKIVIELDKSEMEYQMLENGKIEHFYADELLYNRVIFRVRACYFYVSYENEYTRSIPCNYRMSSSSSKSKNEYNRNLWFDDKLAMDALKMGFDQTGIAYRLSRNGDIEHHSKDKKKVQIIIDKMILCLYGKTKTTC